MKSIKTIISLALAIMLSAPALRAAGNVAPTPAGKLIGQALTGIFSNVGIAAGMPIANFLINPHYSPEMLNAELRRPETNTETNNLLMPTFKSLASEIIQQFSNPASPEDRAYIAKKLSYLNMAMVPNVLGEEQRTQLANAAAAARLELTEEQGRKIDSLMKLIAAALRKTLEATLPVEGSSDKKAAVKLTQPIPPPAEQLSGQYASKQELTQRTLFLSKTDTEAGFQLQGEAVITHLQAYSREPLLTTIYNLLLKQSPTNPWRWEGRITTMSGYEYEKYGPIIQGRSYPNAPIALTFDAQGQVSIEADRYPDLKIEMRRVPADARPSTANDVPSTKIERQSSAADAPLSAAKGADSTLKRTKKMSLTEIGTFLAGSMLFLAAIAFCLLILAGFVFVVAFALTVLSAFFGGAVFL